jgi:hypothetical protein
MMLLRFDQAHPAHTGDQDRPFISHPCTPPPQTNTQHNKQAPQAAWAAARRPPSDKGGAMLPQKPQPSKKQLQQPFPGVFVGGQGKVVVAAGSTANPSRKVREQRERGGGGQVTFKEVSGAGRTVGVRVSYRPSASQSCFFLFPPALCISFFFFNVYYVFILGKKKQPPVILPRVNRQQQQQQQQQQSSSVLGTQGILSSASASTSASASATTLGDPNVSGKKTNTTHAYRGLIWWVGPSSLPTQISYTSPSSVDLFFHRHTHTQARPSLRALSLLALQRGAPFIGFGLVDNAIMIVAGASHINTCTCRASQRTHRHRHMYTHAAQPAPTPFFYQPHPHPSTSAPPPQHPINLHNHNPPPSTSTYTPPSHRRLHRDVHRRLPRDRDHDRRRPG